MPQSPEHEGRKFNFLVRGDDGERHPRDYWSFVKERGRNRGDEK
jgi:hypothetical protein